MGFHGPYFSQTRSARSNCSIATTTKYEDCQDDRSMSQWRTDRGRLKPP